MATPTTTTYFGYGSNLWREQMALRCPTAALLGVGRLDGHRWIIDSRGYANVVPDADPAAHVYGLVYALRPADEARLDRNEGVPVAYEKVRLPVQFWSAGDAPADVGTDGEGEREMLVYIGRGRTEDGSPKPEYVLRMNKGVEDALRLGVPREYVDRVISRFIPEAEDGEELKALAQRQAAKFEDDLTNRLRELAEQGDGAAQI